MQPTFVDVWDMVDPPSESHISMALLLVDQKQTFFLHASISRLARELAAIVASQADNAHPPYEAMVPAGNILVKSVGMTCM